MASGSGNGCRPSDRAARGDAVGHWRGLARRAAGTPADRHGSVGSCPTVPATPSSLLRLRVIRLEFPVAVRPLGARIADDARARLEVALAQPQRHAAEEHGGAADAGNRAERVRFAAGEHAIRRSAL
jgi:hypothetical protein